jgi:diguanylate cyclase
MSSSTATSIERWLVVPSDAQRAYLHYALLALGLYAAFAAMAQVEAAFGVIDRDDAIRLALFNLTGAATFVMVIRSGANRHFRSDPSLLQAQCIFAIVSLCWSYAIQAQARGALLSIVVLILVFGMFALTAAQAVRVTVAASAMLGAVMSWKSQSDPARYPATVELMHFLVAAVSMLGIAVLAMKVARMRLQMGQQNAALSDALAQIRRLATQDELTGLLNRRHMSELLEIEKLRHDRTRHATCLVLIDIDLFKRINDEHGHAAGDAVLKAFAQAATDSLRASDVLARWGGEEFLLMLPDTDPPSALSCIERIRANLAQSSFATIEPVPQVTFSAGLSVLRPGDTVQTSVERADRAMYSAKRAGRACTVVS